MALGYAVCVCVQGGGKGVGKGNWMAANSNDIEFGTYMLVVLSVVACVLPTVAWGRGFKCRYNAVNVSGGYVW